MRRKGAAQRDPPQPDRREGGGSNAFHRRAFCISPIMRAPAGRPVRAAHNSGAYVTCPTTLKPQSTEPATQQPPASRKGLMAEPGFWRSHEARRGVAVAGLEREAPVEAGEPGRGVMRAGGGGVCGAVAMARGLLGVEQAP